MRQAASLGSIHDAQRQPAEISMQINNRINSENVMLVVSLLHFTSLFIGWGGSNLINNGQKIVHSVFPWKLLYRCSVFSHFFPSGVSPVVPYCERRWQSPGVSTCRLSGPCAACAGSAGSAGCAATWPTRCPGYAPPPPAPRQSARRCLQQKDQRF